MTRRHERLIPLTHDHHHALANARRLRVAADSDVDERRAAAGVFLDFFDQDAVTHFREEEEVVFPLIVHAPETETPLIRVLLEHVRMHALVDRLRREVERRLVSAEILMDLAKAFEGHIRFEEKVVFPLVESAAGSALDGIELANRKRGGGDER
jgi:hemerythrin-like domain-containing protein